MLTRPENIPDAPGCYRFLAADGRVLYVGKAKSLAARLKSYFPPDVSTLHPRTQAMRAEATRVVWVELASEDEALLQEAALIRSLEPPYNVRLRTDAAYPFLVLSEHATPRFLKTHDPSRSQRAFGPFPSGAHAHLLAEAVALTCALRPCRDAVLRQHEKLGRPCLLGETGRCSAPCVDPSGYEERVERAVKLLRGDLREARVELEQRMATASATRAFESAARLRDAIAAVEKLSERVVPTLETVDVAVVGVASDDIGAAASVLVVRDGVLVAAPTFLVDRSLAMTTSELTAELVTAHVLASSFSAEILPPPLIASRGVIDAAVLSSLSTLASRKVTARTPRRGALVELLALAEQNATTTLLRARRQRASDADARRGELQALAEAISLPAAPLRIECLDVSHLMGRHTTAAFAVLEEGQPRPNRNRTFNIDSGNDDVLSIALAVRRRIAIYREQQQLPVSSRDPVLSHLPQLLLIDGGPTQLAAAIAVVQEEGVELPLASLAKRLEEVFLPDTPAPLRLELDSPALYVLQRARDAAHKLSVQRQRRRRQKAASTGSLDGIPGLGDKRRERLVKEFGSQKALRAASREEYPAWLPGSVADAVFAALNP